MKKAFVLVSIFLVSLALSNVLVSIKPLYLIAKELTNHEIDILIDPNTNPHMFQLKPSDVIKIEKADVFIALGYGFEEWLTKLRNEKFCLVTEGLERTMDENSHVWLDPVLAIFLASEMARCLEEIYPDERESIEFNLVRFIDEVVKETKALQEKFSDHKGTVILELRPALHHFVKRFVYGDYVTLVDKTQPSLTPRRLKNAINICKKEYVKAILIERNSSEKIAEPLLRSCKLKKVKVDVLGTDFDDYFEFLESVANSVLEAIE